MDGDDALFVEPYALEDEREELALGGGVCLSGPEDREVLEHLAGLVEVGEWAGGELGKLGVDCFAAGHVLGAVEVAKLIEIACAGEALFERGAPLGGVGGICGTRAREAAEDLLAYSRGGLEVGDELDEPRLYDIGVDEWLVTGVLGATGGAVVAGHTSLRPIEVPCFPWQRSQRAIPRNRQRFEGRPGFSVRARSRRLSCTRS